MLYNKLVRDRIPEIIKAKNETPITHIADDQEYEIKLKEKLKEEVAEFLKDSNPEELADILEVVYALGDNLGVDTKELEKIRAEKADKRGGFKEKIILDETN
jgi:predicted house-cleaning noncanonical NTP pyrophosphatase (MazG superfamily)